MAAQLPNKNLLATNPDEDKQWIREQLADVAGKGWVRAQLAESSATLAAIERWKPRC